MGETLAQLFISGYKAGEELRGRSEARAAAQKQYGAKAGDPGLFSALQKLELDERAADRADSYLDVAQDQNSRAEQAVRAGNDPASIAGAARRRADESQNARLKALDLKRERTASLAMINALRLARDNDEDLGEVFDKYVESGMMATLGVIPEDIPRMREQLLANPDMLDSFAASLADPDDKPTRAAAAKAAKAETARSDVTMIIGEMRELYKDLDIAGGIPTAAEHTAGQGVSRYMRSSALGRITGRVFGTKSESNRRSIEGMAPKLLAAMKAAEGLGAKMFDSQRDMELWMATVTDPSQDIQTVRRLLDMFDNQYGKALQGQNINTINKKDIEAQMAEDAPDRATPTVLYPGFVNPNNGATFKGGDYKDPANWTMPTSEPSAQTTSPTQPASTTYTGPLGPTTARRGS